MRRPGPGRTALVGHSSGAESALYAALDVPDRGAVERPRHFRVFRLVLDWADAR